MLATNGSKTQFRALNSQKNAAIHRFFYQNPHVQVCRKAKHWYVFSGGVSIDWGEGPPKRTGVGEAELTDLMEFLRQALDYKDMFGFCPVKFSKRTNRVTIPEFGTGDFYVSLDPKSLQSDVHFEPKGEGAFLPSKRKGAKRDVRVFVWPGRKPNFADGCLKSDIYTVLKDFYILKELTKNALDADYNNAHPTMFTQSRREKLDPSAVSDDVLYAEAELGWGATTNESYSYRVNRFRRGQMDMVAGRFNAVACRRGDTGDPLDDDCEVPRRQTKRQRTWHNNFEPLPEGEEIAKTSSAEARKDLLQWQTKFEEEVCMIMGVPSTVISGATARKFKDEARQETALLKQSITSDRQDLEAFYRFVYDAAHRIPENAALLGIYDQLLETKKRVKAEPGRDDDATELRRRVKDVKRVSSMRSRARIVFDADPFQQLADTQLILTAASRGALTEMEEINLLRDRLSLERVHDANGIAALKKPPESGRRKSGDDGVPVPVQGALRPVVKN